MGEEKRSMEKSFANYTGEIPVIYHIAVTQWPQVYLCMIKDLNVFLKKFSEKRLI